MSSSVRSSHSLPKKLNSPKFETKFKKNSKNTIESEGFDITDDEIEPWLDKPFVQKQVLKELRVSPDFRQITVLSLEKQGIEKIFELLTACVQL
jgi:hypothetical protein